MPPRFDLATDADEPEIRRILRDNPMPGPIALSSEREPDARIAAGVEGPLLHQTIVGRRGDGGLFGFGTRAARLAYGNGTPTPLGYLGALRLDADHRGNAAALRQGYRVFRALHDRDRLTPFYLTSILNENAPARRLLEAGLPGMPTYRFMGELATLVVSTRRVRTRARTRLRRERGLRFIRARPEHRADVAAWLDQCGRHFAFRPWWGDDVPTPGLGEHDFRLAFDGPRLVGCAAVWDQRSFRQNVVRGYAPSLRRARHAYNAFASFAGRPRLPAIGAPVAVASVSHLAIDAPDVGVALVEALSGVAARRGIEMLAIGVPAGGALPAALQRAFDGREIRSRLYVVHWPDGRDAVDALDARPAWPEVALL